MWWNATSWRWYWRRACVRACACAVCVVRVFGGWDWVRVLHGGWGEGGCAISEHHIAPQSPCAYLRALLGRRRQPPLPPPGHHLPRGQLYEQDAKAVHVHRGRAGLPQQLLRGCSGGSGSSRRMHCALCHEHAVHKRAFQTIKHAVVGCKWIAPWCKQGMHAGPTLCGRTTGKHTKRTAIGIPPHSTLYSDRQKLGARPSPAWEQHIPAAGQAPLCSTWATPRSPMHARRPSVSNTLLRGMEIAAGTLFTRSG